MGLLYTLILPLVLSDIWRTCNKIRAAIFRGGINLWDYYSPLDPQRNSLISESKFVSVLTGPLKGPVGLSDQEIAELADYFRVHDGRIFYTQFCQVIHDSVPDFVKNPPLVTGLEWEDPFHVNPLSVSEERRLQLLMTKIAALVNLRRLVLRPYFQDYELVAKNVGTATISHFARVLSFLGILVSEEDFHLLLKKFLKDSYTVNYVAFIAAIDDIVKYLDHNLLLDLGGDILTQYPSRAISAELPKLPRPEIGHVHASDVFGLQSIFHPSLDRPVEKENLQEVIRRMQRHVFTNRIRVGQFFQDFDPMNCGRITVSQFRRGLDRVGINAIDRLYLSEPEIDMILQVYRDPNDSSRMCWKTFEDDIDQVFTIKELEKIPDFQLVTPPQEVMQLLRKGAQSWENVETDLKDLCERALERLKQKISKRRILLRPQFQDYDPHNNGHVSRAQFRQCLLSNGLLSSNEELYALEQRYNDELGFNYFWFLKEVEPNRYEEPLYNAYSEEMKRLNCRETKRKSLDRERDIVEILAKIKGHIVRRGVRVIEFLEQFDSHNQYCVSREDFARGLDNCCLQLTPTELETLMSIFASPMRRDYVDYRRFCETVEEAVTQACLERAPLIVPLQHIPTRDTDRNFLNFEERQLVSMGLQKLVSAMATKRTGDLLPLFQDHDRAKCGTVPKGSLLQVLSIGGLQDALSGREIEVVAKCFALERGLRDEFNYREFCKAVDLLQVIVKRKPF